MNTSDMRTNLASDQRYAVFQLPTLSPDILDEFPKLPLDPYCQGEFRNRRFSQYKLRGGPDWKAEVLPPRPYIQKKKDNSLLGGSLRSFESLRIDPSAIVASGANALDLDTEAVWQVDVHQWRIVTDDSVPGISVPEGPHQDGHMFSMIAVIARFNISGGETELLDLDTDERFFSIELQPMQGLVIDDRSMRHNATNISSKPGESGYRDLFLLGFNPWSERRYGAEYEKEILGQDA